MISTGCEGCCFFKKGDKSRWCTLAQLCATKDEKTFAPGYCRYCRSDKWAKKQDETNVGKLVNKAIQENELKFDLLVFFDENIDSLESLNKTLNNDWYTHYCKKIIIVDTTGFGERKNIALQYIKNNNLSVPIIVDSSVANEPISQRESTTRRLLKQVTSPFFMAIPAGGIVTNMSALAKNVQYVPSRVIHWVFPSITYGTMVVPTRRIYGLFITKPYSVLTGSPEAKTFSEQLPTEEQETGMGLSWFCQECALV